MPPPYVTSNGMRIPTVEELIADMVSDQRADIDPLIDTDAEEVVGQMNGIVSSSLRSAYEVLLVAYNAFDPDNVDDARVDALCAITGTPRQGATKSRFTGSRKLMVNLDAATTLPLGTIFEVNGNPNIRVVTTGTLWSDIDTDTGSLDSTIAGDYYVNAEAETAGRIPINAATLTVITTPIVGLNSVTNPTDAILGKEIDTTEELLVRREDELAELGDGTPDAIRAHVLAIEIDGDRPVLECSVFVNDGDTIDALGLPGHSMEVLVFDGVGQDADDDVIAQTIWDSKPGGTQMVGSETGTAIDSEGDAQVVHFSRPALTGVDVDVTINRDAVTYAGSQAVYDAWKAYADAIPTGLATEVQFSQAIAAILKVQGVTGVETIRLRRHGGSYLSAFTDLPLLPREKATADASASYVAITIA